MNQSPGGVGGARDSQGFPGATTQALLEALGGLRAATGRVHGRGRASTCGSLPHLEDMGRGTMAVEGYLSTHGNEAYVGQIAQGTGLAVARVSNLVGTLEAKGLVERHHSREDNRRVTVRLTPQGEERCRQIQGAMGGYVEALLTELGPEDSTELIRLIAAVTRAVEKVGPPTLESTATEDQEGK